MKSMRYIITRPDLQEGSLRLLKYLDALFPQPGPVQFVDDQGTEHTVQVDRAAGRIWGVGALYHTQHLGVNDVLMLTALAPGRYQAEGIVKPYASPPPPRPAPSAAPETRRVVTAATPHVREVRMQTVRPVPAAEAPAREPAREAAAPAPRDLGRPTEAPRAEQVRADQPRPEPARTPARKDARASSDFRPLDVRFDRPTAAPAPALPQDSAGQLGELARLTGYRLHELGGGVTRLTADLGTHGYSVLVAHQPDALNGAAWTEAAEYRVLLTDEATRPEGVARLTREALIALIEHARLAPLSAVDLRGYWKAGSVDLESAASVAEMVSAHLAQRGTFSFVLLTLAQQPAHSVVSVPRLAERLGSGVNYAELGSILDTLTRPPFLALTPLPAGQYLLRVGVAELLSDMAEYADVVRRRIRLPAPAAAAPAREREAVRA